MVTPLMLLLGSTFIVSVALGHTLPVAQTVMSGQTYRSMGGPIELFWPYQSDGTYGGIQVESANILLKPAGTDGTDCTQVPLPATVITCGSGQTVASLPVACPLATYTDACARLSLALPSALGAGAYELVYQVVHLDGYVERTTVRFTIDPSYVPPSPSVRPTIISSPSMSPTPKPSLPTPTASRSPGTGSIAPSPTAKPSASSEASSLTPSPTPTVTPSASLSDRPIVAPLASAHDPYTLEMEQWVLLGAALPLFALASFVTARLEVHW